MPSTGALTKMLEYLASKRWGQKLIKKMDTLLWAVEKPAKYCLDGGESDDSGDSTLPWPIFWTILIYLQMFRIIASMIMVQFNKTSIETADVVKAIRKWRRTLRSIRFRGLRQIRERKNGTATVNGGKMLLIVQSMPHFCNKIIFFCQPCPVHHP